MISSPDTSRFRAAEFIQFHRNAIVILGSNDPTALGVAAQNDALLMSVSLLDAEFKRPTGNELTAQLIELDLKRDTALMGVTMVVRGYQNHFEEAVRLAATRLDAAFSSHGPDVPRLRYQQESAVIKSILDDLSAQPELTSAVATLHLDAWVTYLGATNMQFDAVFVERSQQTAGDPSKVLELRAAVSTTWDTLKGHLTAHATLTPSQAYTDVVQQLNSLIADYNQAVSGRAGTPDAPVVVPDPAVA